MLVKGQIKKVFEKKKPHCNIGTIGHVDHGKTTLTAAITRVLQNVGDTHFKSYSDIDCNVDERARGITINASHIEYESINRHYSHIDCPGHQQYVKHMLTGAIQMEGAILVVAVNDGPQVQTREHIILAKEVNIKYIIVYINKLDSALEADLKDLVELETRELLENYGYPEDLPVVRGSARSALEESLEEPSILGIISINKLIEVIDSYIPQPERLIDSPFLLSIESIHIITGRGTVVTGKIEQGILHENDELELVGKDIKKTICMSIEMFNKIMTYAEVGDNVGILIKNIKKDFVKKGNILAAPDTMKIYKSFIAKVYILTKQEGGRHKPFISSYKPQFFFRTVSITGEIILPEALPFVMPGDSASFTVILVELCPLNIGLKFIMREGIKTLGAGYIVDVL